MQRKITNNVPIDKIVKSFANKNRIAVLHLLEETPELSLEDIAEKINMEYKTIASHINKLAIAGLVVKRYEVHKVHHQITTRGNKVLKFLRTLE